MEVHLTRSACYFRLVAAHVLLWRGEPFFYYNPLKPQGLNRQSWRIDEIFYGILGKGRMDGGNNR